MLLQAEEENSHIIKIFFLQFINRYCALLYTAFWLKDMVTLRYLLISLLTLQALLGNLWEYFGAYIIAFGKKLFKKNGLTGARSSSNSPTRSQSSATGTLTTDVDDKFKTLDDNYDADASINVLEKLLAEEIGKPTYDINDDYLELVLQFGYVIMFAVVLPVAPLAALVNNIFEYWVDIHKIGICRKPTHTRRSNMGAWLWCLEFISFISVLTNCYLVTMVSTHVDILIPTSFHKFLATEEGKIVVMLLIEHVLMAIKVVMAVLIDDVPRKVSEALAYERVRNKQLEAKKRMMNFTNDVQSSVYGTDRSNNHPFSPVPLSASTSISRVSKRGSNSDLRISTLKANAGTSSAVDDTRSTTSKQSSRVNLLDKGNTLAMAHLSPEMLKPTINYPLDDKNKSDVTTDDRTELEISVSKLEKQCDTQFGFDPMNMMLLVATPLLLQYFHLSPYLYFPISALCFGYLKAQKDRADRKAAIGIISDPAIMKLVIEEMPSWVSDAEFQRVEWINNILQKLWGNLATAVEVEVMKSIQPILDKHTPPFLTMLKLKRISLGSISPKIVGIRVFHTSESVVRIDVEFRWAGDPLVSLKVGTLPLPIPIEVSKLRVSGKVRIELLEMTHQLPCFKAISVTCMEKPFVDFSLKVASLDLMNIGAAEYNIMRIVRNIIHSIVSNIALYPKKIIVPMNKGVDVDALATLTPIGILYITFIRGKDLKQVIVPFFVDH